jgi:hypothetical protein
MAQLKREAARQGRTMSELVETALRILLRGGKTRVELPPLTTFKSGGALVDVADRDTLYQGRDTDFHRFPFLEPLDPMK